MAAIDSLRSGPPITQQSRREIRKILVGLAFISPWVVGFLWLTLYPMLASLYYGFTDFQIPGSARMGRAGQLPGDVLSRQALLGLHGQHPLLCPDLHTRGYRGQHRVGPAAESQRAGHVNLPHALLRADCGAGGGLGNVVGLDPQPAGGSGQLLAWHDRHQRPRLV